MRQVVVAFLCLVLIASRSQAASITYSLDEITTSSGTPGGTAPWLTVNLDDGDTPGTVQMSFAATGLVGAEFVSDLYLNLDPALNPADLSFSGGTASGGNGFALPSVDLGIDAFLGGGSGRYDVKFEFTTSNAGGGSQRFGPGEVFQITISGISSLVASSFAFQSTPSGGNGVHHALAHIQGIAQNASAFVAAPEPTGLALCGIGLPAIWFLSRRRSA